jgi:hypothetical protein
MPQSFLYHHDKLQYIQRPVVLKASVADPDPVGSGHFQKSDLDLVKNCPDPQHCSKLYVYPAYPYFVALPPIPNINN